jgi:hypothetical protein
MLSTAQQHYSKGDHDTANWLVQWAQCLTDGRIGAVEFAEIQAEVSRQTASPIPLTIAEGDIESTLFDAFDDTRNSETPPAADASLALPACNPLRAEEIDELEADGQHLEANSRVEPGAFAGPRDQTLEAAVSPAAISAPRNDRVSRQLALAMPDGFGTAGADSLRDRRLVESNESSIVIAVVSFVAGTAFCALLCLVLCVVPFRLRLDRRVEPSSRVDCETPAPTVQPAGLEENENWIVEAFYNQNVELYGQMAQSG